MTAGAIARCRERVSVRGAAEQPESSREVLTPAQEGTTELEERGNARGGCGELSVALGSWEIAPGDVGREH